MRPVLVTSIFTACALAAGVAMLARPAPAAEDRPGRYTMTPAEGGALKLDTLTGAVSLCTRAGEDWACKPTKDGEQALRREIDGLKGEIDVLKDQLTKMEEIAGIGDPGKDDGRPGGRPQAKMDLPSEKDVDQAFDYFERMVKKLRERLNKIEREGKSGQPL